VKPDEESPVDGRMSERDAAPHPATQITAVIPAYNRERTIARAIDSALAQRFAPVEVIVVDDGSRDGTRRVVEGYGPPVRCVAGEHRRAGAARNRGVREARSEWVAFLDSDDYWLADHLERMVAAIHGSGARADLYFSDLLLSADQGGELLWKTAGFSIDGPYALREDATEWGMLPMHPMMLQTCVIRRSAFLEVGGLPEETRMREDTHLFFKLTLGRPVCAVAGCGAEMTADEPTGGRISHRYGPGSRFYWEATVELYEDALARNPQLAPPQVADLRRRIAVAHYWLVRRVLWDGEPLGALRHFAAGFRSDPGELGRKVRRWLGLGHA
jgi:hypothetical protein